MLVTLDTDLLATYKLTPDQFLLGYLIDKNRHDLISLLYENSYLVTGPSNYKFVGTDINKKKEASRFISCFNRLKELGFIIDENDKEGEYDLSKISVTPSFRGLYRKEGAFEELLEVYPTFVIRPDGTKDNLKVDLPKCRKIYNSLVKNNKSLHEHIIKCLHNELSLRTVNGTMRYMKRLPKWLSAEEWKSYEESDVSSTSAKTETDIYGTKLE